MSVGTTKVEFQDYFLTEFLNKTRSKSLEMDDVDLRKTLSDFVDSLMAAPSIVEGVELLAQFQGTSDLSIFFADIFENILILSPEEVSVKIEELSNDLIEMFRLLEGDANWEEALENFKKEIPPVAQQPEKIKESVTTEEVEKVGVREFCEGWLKKRFAHLFNQVISDNRVKALGKELYTILGSTDQENMALTKLKELPYFVSLLQVYYSVTEFRTQEIDEFFMENFFSNVDSLIDDFIQILETNIDELEMVLAQVNEDELTSMEDSARRLEEHIAQAKTPQEKPEPVVKDAISSYLRKEIQENILDIQETMEELSQDPDNETLRKNLLDAIAYFEELGSVHSINLLKKMSEQITGIVEEIFSIKIGFNTSISAVVSQILEDFGKMVDSELQGESVVTDEAIQEKITELRNLITESALMVGVEEETYSLSVDRKKIIEFFEEIHQYYWELISKEYARWLSHRDRRKHADLLIHWLNHLLYWYSLLEITHLNPAIKALIEIFDTLEYGEVSTELDAYCQHFLMQIVASPHIFNEVQISEFIEKVKSEGIQVDKRIEKMSLGEARASIWEIISEDFSKTLENFASIDEFTKRLVLHVDQLKLIQNNEMADSLKRLNAIIKDDEQVWKESDFQEKIKNKIIGLSESFLNKNSIEFAQRVDDIEDACLSFKFDKEMKQHAPTILLVEDEDEEEGDEVEVSQKTEMPEDTFSGEGELGEEEDLENLFSETVFEEPGVDEPVSETLSDDEIFDLFLKETSKYIDEILESVVHLKEKPDDSVAIAKINHNAHSIKGSARMMGEEIVGNLSEILEELYAELLESVSPVTEEILKLTEEITGEIKNKETSQADVNRYKEYVKSLKQESEVSSEDEASQTENVLKLSEQDDELIQIFRDEAADTMNQLKGNLEYIEKNKDEDRVVKEAEQSIHKINSAAKMLGFSEIGAVMDYLEEIIELRLKGDIDTLANYISLFIEGLAVVQKLMETKEIDKNTYYLLVEKLESAKKRQPVLPPQDEGVDTETTEKQKNIIALFVGEAEENLKKIRQSFLDLEVSPDDQDKIYTVFRMMHTLKGAASMVKFDKLEQLTHSFEDVLEKFYQEAKPLTSNFLTVLRLGIEEIEYILNHVKERFTEKTSSNYDSLRKRLVNLDNLTRESVSDDEIPQRVKDTATGIEYPDIEDSQENSVKISIRRLNELMNLIAELVINDTEVSSRTEKLFEIVPELETERKETSNLLRLAEDLYKQNTEILKEDNRGDLDKLREEQLKLIQPALKELYEKVESRNKNMEKLEKTLKYSMKGIGDHIEKAVKLTHQLHNDILQARMVPISHLFDRFPAAVKNLAQKHGKEINLVIEGGQTELDRILVEHLYEPLLHTLRNAIDHGIETPEEREKADKNKVGTIKLSAKQEKGQIVINIEDDGRGIDYEKIKERLVEKKMISEKDINSLSKDKIVEFLFHPGFSTSDKVSEISGRGIGLDVVKREVNRIKGDVMIISDKGEGTIISFRFPMTLTVTQTMLVTINKMTYGIPLFYVDQSLEINKQEIIKENDQLYIKLGDQQIPLLNLATIFENPEKKSGEEANLQDVFTCIVTEVRGIKIAMAVDYIQKRAELIIRALSPNLNNIPYISGVSVLADGTVTFIIDIEEIIEDKIINKDVSLKEKLKNSVILTSDQLPVKHINSPSELNVLILDDSKTFRTLMVDTLNSFGYNVTEAESVEDAWKKLKAETVDLAIVDLDLPEISGYDFINQIQEDENYKNLPIMLLTGKKMEMVELLANDLGVLGYILKPFSKESLQKALEQVFEIKED